MYCSREGNFGSATPIHRKRPHACRLTKHVCLRSPDKGYARGEILCKWALREGMLRPDTRAAWLNTKAGQNPTQRKATLLLLLLLLLLALGNLGSILGQQVVQRLHRLRPAVQVLEVAQHHVERGTQLVLVVPARLRGRGGRTR